MTSLNRRSVGKFAIALLLLGFLLAPLLIVIPMSFSEAKTLQFPPRGFTTDWYQAALTQAKWSERLATSALVACLTVIASTTVGTLAAIGITRGQIPGKTVVSALVLSPLIVPSVITAIAMFGFFSTWKLIGSLPVLVAAHTVMALPFVVIAVSAGLRTVDQNLELAARTLGANRRRVLWHVTLPTILPSVAVAAILAFVTSWDEVVISLFLTSPTFKTLPVVVWQQINESIDPTVAAVSTLLMLVTTISLLVVGMLGRRRAIV